VTSRQNTALFHGIIQCLTINNYQLFNIHQQEYYLVTDELKCQVKDYNRGFGIIRHNSPKVAANDLYTYENKPFLRTIDNF